MSSKARPKQLMLTLGFNSIGALPEFEWRRVIVRGLWDHAHSVLMGPKVDDGKQGFSLVTPLQRPSGSTILVDRGFVDKTLAEASRDNKNPDALMDGEVEVTGMLRLQPKKNSFTPDNAPEKGTWYWPDIPQLVENAGGKAAGVQPVLVEAVFREFTPEYSNIRLADHAPNA